MKSPLRQKGPGRSHFGSEMRRDPKEEQQGRALGWTSEVRRKLGGGPWGQPLVSQSRGEPCG